ncbi:NAD(P)/FAD-dependent oxidoreductase [Patescibacteria group bacterium]|nr:NAD(P)/FAD-dependent oxidoreductase [Patescibacteria group bacterium]
MEKYDVAIVGAGPSGLRAAEILARADKKVLLLEKNNAIGPKVCAGGLTRKCIKLLKLPPELTERSYQSAIFNSPRVKTRLEFGKIFGYTVSRKKLGQWQLEKIKNTSVEVRTGAEVIKITDQEVSLKNGECFQYKYLIGADGSNSIVRKFLKLPIKRIGVAFYYIVPQIFSEIEVTFNSKLFGPWFSWIFPYQNSTSIGFGCFPRIIPMERARANFDLWLKLKKIDISGAKFEASPINCDYRGVKFGNIFLVGDAAGLVSGFTGEGIYQALVSGEEVARKIIDPNYRMPKIKEIRREINLHHLMLGIVWLSGPFRNNLFNLVTRVVKNKFWAVILARVLT